MTSHFFLRAASFCQQEPFSSWSSDSHRETGGVGMPSQATYSEAFKESLACPGDSREDNSPAKVSPCSSEVVVGPRQSSERSTVTPNTARPPTVYQCLKQRLGRTLGRLHCKRPLVQVRRRLAHKFARTQGGPIGPKIVRAIVLEPDHSSLHGQHDSGFVYQQGRGYEIRLSLCSPVETPSVVQPKADCVTSQTHSRSPKCHCQQTVKTQTGDADRVVSPSGDFRPSLPAVARTGSRLICSQVQSQTSQVCVPGSRQVSPEGRYAESPVGGSGRVCLPSNSPTRTSGIQTFGPRLLPAHSDCSRVAKHAMVLGTGQHVSSNSPLTSPPHGNLSN